MGLSIVHLGRRSVSAQRAGAERRQACSNGLSVLAKPLHVLHLPFHAPHTFTHTRARKSYPPNIPEHPPPQSPRLGIARARHRRLRVRALVRVEAVGVGRSVQGDGHGHGGDGGHVPRRHGVFALRQHQSDDRGPGNYHPCDTIRYVSLSPSASCLLQLDANELLQLAIFRLFFRCA